MYHQRDWKLEPPDPVKLVANKLRAILTGDGVDECCGVSIAAAASDFVVDVSTSPCPEIGIALILLKSLSYQSFVFAPILDIVRLVSTAPRAYLPVRLVPCWWQWCGLLFPLSTADARSVSPNDLSNYDRLPLVPVKSQIDYSFIINSNSQYQMFRFGIECTRCFIE